MSVLFPRLPEIDAEAALQAASAVRRAAAEMRIAPPSEQVLQELLLPWAAWLAARHTQEAGPSLVGISGAQGAGKSTLAQLLRCALEQAFGLQAAVLSLDDFYLTRAERDALARDVHPLFRWRGVPGTHDLLLANRTLDALKAAKSPVQLPRFDKATDDRADAARWPTVHRADILLLEGWCLGATPVPPRELLHPLNAREREEDSAGTWRGLVNAELHGPYREFFARLDTLVFLRAPNFECVCKWREQQEAMLRDQVGIQPGLRAGLMTDAEISQFVALFERITRSMLRDTPAIADAVLQLDAGRRVIGATAARGW